MGLEGCIGCIGVCWDEVTIEKGAWECGWVHICMFWVCIAAKISVVSCMGVGMGMRGQE